MEIVINHNLCFDFKPDNEMHQYDQLSWSADVVIALLLVTIYKVLNSVHYIIIVDE